ncbi:MAG: prephenate dehydrogenase, partial [Chthoniobacterales bacterium]
MGGEISHVAVFGPGLMGASLLMALRKRSPHTKLSVWARRKEAADEIVKRGLADAACTDAAEAATSADTIVLCVPVDRMEDVARSIAPHIAADTLVTDVGSTKKTIAAKLEEIFSKNSNFIGSHPMCGSEESGMGAARADLYESALCVVCPTDSSRPELLEKVESLWKTVGGRVAQLS